MSSVEPSVRDGEGESEKRAADGTKIATLESVRGEPEALSNIKHSVRTPLNQIIGYTEMLEEDLTDLNRPELLPDLRKIHTAAGQLLALFNDGLAAWKFETGTVDLDSIRLEMRTPLNLIIGYSELCQEIVEEEKESQWIPDLKKISGAAHNLLNLVESNTFPTILAIGGDPARQGSSSNTVLGSENATQTTTFLRRPATPWETSTAAGVILLVDDNAMNRNMLGRRIERQGHKILEAEDGREALEILREQEIDLMLLDVEMPGVNGFEVLQRVKADPDLRKTAVIMLSALDEIDIVVSCIQNGADDYVPKPFNPVLLNARIAASLEKKRLRDKADAYTEELRVEREKSETLLYNTLPKIVANRLRDGSEVIAEQLDSVTVLFADIAGFTPLAGSLEPRKLVEILNDIFSSFDWLAELYSVEKIKTIGDAYMAAGGIPDPHPNHAANVAELALALLNVVRTFGATTGIEINIRIGISSGPVVAGVIGRKKYQYDLWGDTVNMASRMESHGAIGRVQVSESTYDLLRDEFEFESRGKVDIKGKGEVNTYFLLAKKRT